MIDGTMTLLKFLRLARGLSKVEAIRLVVLPPDQYALLEAGIVPQYVHVRAAQKLETAFGYPFDHLLSDAGALIDRALQRHGVQAQPSVCVVDCGSPMARPQTTPEVQTEPSSTQEPALALCASVA